MYRKQTVFLALFSIALVGCDHVSGPSTALVEGSWTYTGVFAELLEHAPCEFLPATLTFVQQDTSVIGTFDTLRAVCVRATGTDTSNENAGNQVGSVRGNSIFLASDRVLLWHRGTVRNHTIEGAILGLSLDSIGYFLAIKQ